MAWGIYPTMAEEHAPPQSHDFKKPATPGKNVFVIEKIAVPIIKSGRIIAYLRLSVHIQSKTSDILETVKTLEFVLRDAFYTDLYSAMSDLWIPNKDPNPESIKKRIQNVANKTLGPDQATVYIKELYLHRLNP